MRPQAPLHVLGLVHPCLVFGTVSLRIANTLSPFHLMTTARCNPSSVFRAPPPSFGARIQFLDWERGIGGFHISIPATADAPNLAFFHVCPKLELDPDSCGQLVDQVGIALLQKRNLFRVLEGA